jgi:CheY-like chemotaxis protein
MLAYHTLFSACRGFKWEGIDLADILVIEDSPEIRGVIRAMLEKEGHHVREAFNGEEGVEQYQAQYADLVLTDLFMPKKSGIETISDLLEIDPEAKIIAMTAHGSKENYDFLKVAMALGAVATLEKPFLSKDLMDAVAKVLEG